MVYYLSTVTLFLYGFISEGWDLMNFNCQVSVIVPVYNVEEYLRKCLDSMVAQTMDKSLMEVLLIDDGSTDSSPAICEEYAEKYSFFKVFHIENNGVSNARNFGIGKAQGRFIMYLDSDDYLSKNAIKGLCGYFEKHYDEIDLMTYTEYQDKDGETEPLPHFRYKYINKTGIYDLNDPDYMYFVQTNMNIIVKNMGEKNVTFDTTLMFHEDQKYIMSILSGKEKIGFYHPAIYYYVKNSGGATGMKRHPYYIHDKTVAMWEDFIRDANAPKFIQAYFLNDFRWKLRFDVIWPYQYKGADFEREVGRFITLLSRVDLNVLIDYPELPYGHKAYILGLVYGDRMSADFVGNNYAVCLDKKPLFDFDRIEVYLSRFRLHNGVLTIVGAIKCVALNFTEEIELSYISSKGGEKEEHKVTLKPSSLSYFQSQTVTNNFKDFILKIPVEAGTKLSFKTKLLGRDVPMYFSYPQTCPFNRKPKRSSYICEGLDIRCKNNKIKIRKANVCDQIRELARSVAYMPKTGFRNMLTRIYAPYYKCSHRIWLYCDSSKTVKDNAYYQFIHDSKLNDGIERYYVYNKDAKIDGWFDEKQKEKLVMYGSVKHRLYILAAEKILTSFYGLRDFMCYPANAFKYFSDIAQFELVYLQHGVLHAHLPTMYSLDRMMLDREVVSTQFEVDNLINNYGFEDSFLIKSGMPRLGHIDASKSPEKKILFAPSWRKFLVEPDGKGSWKPKEKAFLNSEFYKNVIAFLTDPKLEAALKKHGYVLDFKPHPNFRMYDEYFKLNGETVRLAPPTVDEYSYSVFMTDFSSFMFDFIYLKRPILYFMPDLELFEAGLNHYRKLDIPFDRGFGEFSSDYKKAVDDVIALLENGCVPEQKYVDRMNGMFLEVDDPEEALYQELIKS